MTVRVYVPTNLARLARFSEEGGIGPSPVRAHAVTDWLRESWPEAEEDEWEYAALMAAADDAATLLTEEDRPRRVVLVAEVERVVEEGESTEVRVDSAIALRLVRAVQADTADIDPASPEDLGDLGWFGVQEIPDLLN
ncbi:MAG: hypothetical protein ABIR34_05005 [Marmoricola sp.]